MVSRLQWSRDSSALEFILSRSRYRSRDLMANVSVLVSRPEEPGLGLFLETWSARSRYRPRELKTQVLVSRPKKGLDNNTDDILFFFGKCRRLCSWAAQSRDVGGGTMSPTFGISGVQRVQGGGSLMKMIFASTADSRD